MPDIGVLWRIFGPKKDEIIGGWSMLHNKELYNLYLSLSIIKMIKDKIDREHSEHGREADYIQSRDQ
jgi:hypothetical protein